MNKKDIHLVLIHGFIFNKTIWTPLAEKLAQHYTVHLVDLPGYSDHAHLEANTLSEVAQQIFSQVDKRNKFIWVGFSLGGIVALYLAKNFPEHTLGVITLASNPKFVKSHDWTCATSYGAFHMLKRLFNSHPDKALTRFLMLQSQNIVIETRHKQSLLKKCAESLTHEVLLRDLELLEHNDLRTLLSELTCPQLNILAQNDRLVPSSLAEKLKELSPRAKNVTIQDAGHALLLSHTTECLTVIQNFINESIITQ